MGPLFWKLLTAVCLLWYATLTAYVAFRGARDIHEMLRRLKTGKRERKTRPPIRVK
jgi:hypothetical protein